MILILCEVGQLGDLQFAGVRGGGLGQQVIVVVSIICSSGWEGLGSQK